MKYLITIFTVVLLLFSACKNKENLEHDHSGHSHDNHEQVTDPKNDVEHENISTVHDEEHHDLPENETLRLNNGKKWIANDATHVGMSNIKTLLMEYIKHNNTDHVVLASALSKESAMLISKCDMVGEDHEQLHIVLVPILEAIDGIKMSNSRAALSSLEKHLNEYFKHFKTSEN